MTAIVIAAVFAAIPAAFAAAVAANGISRRRSQADYAWDVAAETIYG